MNDAETLKEIPALKEEKSLDGTLYRVLRGGAWGVSREIILRSSCRDFGSPTGRYDHYGFRCVLVVSGD